jgi:hypothetical protein
LLCSLLYLVGVDPLLQATYSCVLAALTWPTSCP